MLEDLKAPHDNSSGSDADSETISFVDLSEAFASAEEDGEEHKNQMAPPPAPLRAFALPSQVTESHI